MIPINLRVQTTCELEADMENRVPGHVIPFSLGISCHTSQIHHEMMILSQDQRSTEFNSDLYKNRFPGLSKYPYSSEVTILYKETRRDMKRALIYLGV